MVSFLLVIGATQACAGGFQSQEQSVRGLGGAHSMEATGSGADFLWWNPAAIGGMDEIEIYVGVHGILADASVRDLGSTISRPFAPVAPIGGSSQSDPVGAAVSPNFAVAGRIDPRWSWGLAVTTPYGFITSVEPDSWTRYQALNLRMMQVSLQPTLAYRATPWLDLGFGLDAAYAESRLTTRLPNLSPLLADGQSTVRGHGWDFGWIAGLTVRPNGRLTLAASYRSRIEHRLGGEATTSDLLGPLSAGNGVVPSVTRFTTPWLLTVGGRWRLNERWVVSAQAVSSGWSAFDTIQVDRPGGAPQPSRRARDTTSFSLGAEFEASPQWTVRAGLQYDPQAIADSAMLADGDRLTTAVGATYRAGARVSLDLAAAYTRFRTSPIASDATAYRGTPLQTPVTLAGQFSARAQMFSAGARWRF